MEISVIDIILFKSSPETLQKEDPEKFQFITEYLSNPENRLKFYQTSEELDEAIQVNDPKNDDELEAKFSEFWDSFQKEYLGIEQEELKEESLSFLEKFKRKLFSLSFPSLVPLCINLFLYWDVFWNQGKFFKNLVSEDKPFDGVFFVQMGEKSYDLFLSTNFGFLILSFLVILGLRFWKESFRYGKLFSFIVLVLGMIGNIWLGLGSHSMVPEWIGFGYIFLSLLVIQRK